VKQLISIAQIRSLKTQYVNFENKSHLLNCLKNCFKVL